MTEQEWLDKMQMILCEFVQNDSDLGYELLDLLGPYWEKQLNDGYSPEEAFVNYLKRRKIPIPVGDDQ